jgi:hypothetical protein
MKVHAFEHRAALGWFDGDGLLPVIKMRTAVPIVWGRNSPFRCVWHLTVTGALPRL